MPDKSKVEAVAQALLDRFRARIAARGGEMPCAIKINECVPSYRGDFIADAEAAIKAMREPTEQMMDYGLECLPEGRHITGTEDVQTMWRVMIDVATDSHG